MCLDKGIARKRGTTQVVQRFRGKHVGSELHAIHEISKDSNTVFGMIAMPQILSSSIMTL